MHNPKVLVLGPGGIKGFLEIGALMALRQCGMLKNVDKIVGVSVGAIIGFLLSLGYTEMEVIQEALDISLMAGMREDLRIDLVIQRIGLLNHNAIRSILEHLACQKLGFSPTLKMLYMATGIELVITATNVNRDKPEYFSYRTDPDLKAVEAVLMSMSIPLVFERLTYKGNSYIDGAFSNPFPVDVFDDGNVEIFGIAIEPEIKEAEALVPFLFRILNVSINQLARTLISRSSEKCCSLVLYTPTSDVLGIACNRKARLDMVASGYVQTCQYLSTRAVQAVHSLPSDPERYILGVLKQKFGSTE